MGVANGTGTGMGKNLAKPGSSKSNENEPLGMAVGLKITFPLIAGGSDTVAR